MTPKARSASIDAGSLPALSPLAAFALAHADGTRTPLDLAALATSTGAEGCTRDAMFRALDELADLGLLEARVAPPAGGPRVRRGPTVESAAALGVTPGLPLFASDDEAARKNQEEKEKRSAEQSDKRVVKKDTKEGGRNAEQSDKRTAEQSDKSP